MNVAELLTVPASIVPDQALLTFEEVDEPYAAAEAEVRRVAGALAALGVGRGDRVALVETNTPSAVHALFATAALGAIFVPLNYRARRDELAHMLSLTEPRVLLAGDRYVEPCREVLVQLPAPPQLVALEAGASAEPNLAGLLESATALDPIEVEDDDLALMMFTSGTTALPKAVMLDHGALTGYVFATTDAADGVEAGSVLVCAPLYHIAGLSSVLTATFGGRRIVLMRQFNAANWLRLVERQQVTHAFLVPTMLKQVLDAPEMAETDFSGLEVLSYGAAPMPVGVIRRAIDALPRHVQFVNAFGQTETTSTVTVLGPEDHRLEGPPDVVERKITRLASIGRPLADVDVAILDADGAIVPSGQVGEIAIRTARVMRGYYGQAEATQATLRDGWLRTRDLGWVDEDGYVFLAGRSSDMIIRGGENVAPAEVELALATHPAVEEVAVFGVADDEWGERVAAAVVRRAGTETSAQALIEHTRQRLASFKTPDRVYFVDELPKNTMGKLVRKELAAQLGGQDGESRG